ncbi:S41 family peptidase [Alkalitalea saponilacus]|uniref:Tricorn protease C1 domain-containing protein n=1 Tax=Alkalitalea saponilacus TaxID=889453 RepID=A0A1T5AXJ7_9BACT|nr:S41 family peptidase [Alkalitalea saponilacus]ASB48560.1 hypothetical protein CDL62_05110 [Alkalitalea saponilacus]SKB39692.1 Tricorn protease C1 domain-containing protein [Alkalitalea saponilacus]
MKLSIKTIIPIIVILTACTDDIINNDASPSNIFRSFWEIMDERYVFFEEKGVNWDSIYFDYQPVFDTVRSNSAMIKAFDSILSHINDKHLSIVSNDGHYAGMFLNDTLHYSISFGKVYSTYDFSNLQTYSHLHLAQLPEGISYIRILPGLKKINVNDLNIRQYDYSNGLIIDLRDCTGGYMSGYNFCSIFLQDERVVFYKQTKAGKGHNDFSGLIPLKIKGENIIKKETPLIVLINRNTYSMGNGIASILKENTNAFLIGETTGGGGGSVMSVLLPAGWSLTFTQSKHYNLARKLIENGINPDIENIPLIDFWKEEHLDTGKDPQIEIAISILQTTK